MFTISCVCVQELLCQPLVYVSTIRFLRKDAHMQSRDTPRCSVDREVPSLTSLLAKKKKNVIIGATGSGKQYRSKEKRER